MVRSVLNPTGYLKLREGTNTLPEDLAIYDKIQCELGVQSAQVGKRSEE